MDTCVARKRKALIVGCDGLRPDLLERIDTPHIDGLIGRGLYTRGLNTWESAQTPHHGSSSPNWASVLTGVTPSLHGLHTNADLGKVHFIDDDGRNPSDGAKVPTLFGALKTHNVDLQTAVIYTWNGIGSQPGGILEYSGSAIDHEYSAGKAPDKWARDKDNAHHAANVLARKQVDGQQFDPDLMFIHLDGTDMHTTLFDKDGDMMPAAVQRIRELDDMVGEMAEAIQNRDSIQEEDWLIVVLSDHGSDDEGRHANNDDPLVRNVPYVFSGSCALRLAIPDPMHSWDITNTVLQHMTSV